MPWTSSVFSPAGGFQASRIWRKIKKPSQLQRNVRIRWSGCYLLLFGYCERSRNNPGWEPPAAGNDSWSLCPKHLVLQEPPFGGKVLFARRFYHLSKNHFLAHFNFQTFPFPHGNKVPPTISCKCHLISSQGSSCHPPHFQHCWAQAILASSRLMRIFLA